MSDLETLKAQHPDFLTRWDRSTVDGFMETTIIGGYVRHEDAAALLALVQQHEATIAELNTQLARARRINRDSVKQICAESDSDLATAQATIQKQARELEEADEALIELFSAWIADDPFISDATTRAANKAKDRHSARAQQDKSETKKEE